MRNENKFNEGNARRIIKEEGGLEKIETVAKEWRAEEKQKDEEREMEVERE